MTLNYTNQSDSSSLKGKTIAFCLPGLMYSGTFMTQMIRLLYDLNQLGVNYYISQQYSSMVNHARTDCLQVDNYAGTMLTPFRGQVPYDYIMWIDSDIVFKTEDLLELLKMNKDISAGWYVQTIGGMATNKTTVVEHMDSKRVYENGSDKYETIEDMMKRTDSFKVDYCGFGWILIKKGVYEKIPYPWFVPRVVQLKRPDGIILEDVCSEDISMCEEFRKYGFDIWVNPKIRVGHQKMVIV
jgi:hypothetical protein